MPPDDTLHRCGAAGLTLLALTCSCSRETEGQFVKPQPSLSVSDSVSPDRLEPDELPEGSEVAFQFTLPRGMRIRFRGPFEIEALGNLPAERVANYVRKRVKSQGVEIGAARTVFDRARLREDESAPFCQIEVSGIDGVTHLVIRDLTPPRVEPELTPEERWKRHGLDPNGGLLDPSRMQ